MGDIFPRRNSIREGLQRHAGSGQVHKDDRCRVVNVFAAASSGIAGRKRDIAAFHHYCKSLAIDAAVLPSPVPLSLSWFLFFGVCVFQRFQKLLQSLLLVQRSWVTWEAFNDDEKDNEKIKKMKMLAVQCYNNILDVGGLVDWHGGNPKLHDLLHLHEAVKWFGAAESTSTGIFNMCLSRELS